MKETALELHDGDHVDDGNWIVSGSARVFVSGSARVEASEYACVWASGKAIVYAYDRARVYASDEVYVRTLGWALVIAFHRCDIDSQQHSKAMLADDVTAEARHTSQAWVIGREKERIYAYNSARIHVTDRSKVTANQSSMVWAVDNARVLAFGESPLVSDRKPQNPEVWLSDRATATTYDATRATAFDTSEVVAMENSRIVAFGAAKIEINDEAAVDTRSQRVSITIPELPPEQP